MPTSSLLGGGQLHFRDFVIYKLSTISNLTYQLPVCQNVVLQVSAIPQTALELQQLIILLYK